MEQPAEGALRAAEVASRLGVSERTVYNYVEEGLLEAASRPSGLRRRFTFTAEAVERCRERLRQAQAQARNGE